MPERFLVIRADQVPAMDRFEVEARAIEQASTKTRNTSMRHVVVQVVAEISPDPQPAVLVQRIPQGESNGKAAN